MSARLFRWLERKIEWLFGTPPFSPETSAILRQRERQL